MYSYPWTEGGRGGGGCITCNTLGYFIRAMRGGGGRVVIL